jgi:hypothetical protein
MAGYQPENYFFYSPMTFKYDFCNRDKARGQSQARRLQPASRRFSPTMPKVPSPLIGVTFTSIP